MKLFITAFSLFAAFTVNAQTSKGWIKLFNGKDMKGWHTYGKTTVGAAWQVDDGAIHLDASHKDGWHIKEGGDIVTDEEFENFDLKLEWKISKNGNSGVMFLVHEENNPDKYKYPWYTGPEMQVLDNDGHSDGKIHKHRAGDLYDLIASSKETVKPVGEWNKAEIICNNAHLELWLNGTKVVETTLWDDAWKKLVAGSKFNAMPAFATFKKGRIALQDHGNEVWFKNIEIKRL